MAQSLRMKRRQRTGLWFVLPAFIFYVVFFAFPFLASFYLGFTEWNGIGEPVFVGLENYARQLSDDAMWKALWNNIIWVIIGTVVPVSLGLLLATMLWSNTRGAAVYRTIYFMPMVLSAVVIGVIWHWIYNPLFGLLNTGLRAVGLGNLATGWLGESTTALYAVLAAAIWTYLGFCIVILFAGLQKVDLEIVNAARIDGANAVLRFRHVIIPQIRPVLTMVIVYTLIGGFNVFDLIWVMTGGGPNNASEVIATYTYETAFRMNEYGYGASLSMVMSVLALLTGLIALWLRRSENV
jgi:raffinose/stachyose/melibiose transport system permease protein